MRYLIIGLGIYGSNLAIDLTNQGHEVIGADSNPTLVESIKDLISTAYVVDATDQAALQALPLKGVDMVIVAIGENFGASVRIVALLKEMEIAHIYARAVDPLHQAILETFQIDRILTPEQRAAADLTAEMALGSNVTSMCLDANHSILRFAAPQSLQGVAYSSLHEHLGGMTLIGATRAESRKNILGLSHPEQMMLQLDSENDYSVEPGDTLICLGSTAQIHKLLSQN